MSSIENAQIHEGKYLTGTFTMPEFPKCPHCGEWGSNTCPDWDVKTNTLRLTGVCLTCNQRRSDGKYVVSEGFLTID